MDRAVPRKIIAGFGLGIAILIANALVPALNLWFRARRTAPVGAPS